MSSTENTTEDTLRLRRSETAQRLTLERADLKRMLHVESLLESRGFSQNPNKWTKLDSVISDALEGFRCTVDRQLDRVASAREADALAYKALTDHIKEKVKNKEAEG